MVFSFLFWWVWGFLGVFVYFGIAFVMCWGSGVGVWFLVGLCVMFCILCHLFGWLCVDFFSVGGVFFWLPEFVLFVWDVGFLMLFFI